MSKKNRYHMLPSLITGFSVQYKNIKISYYRKKKRIYDLPTKKYLKPVTSFDFNLYFIYSSQEALFAHNGLNSYSILKIKMLQYVKKGFKVQFNKD